MTENPRMSVVTIVGQERDRATRCLDSLLAQTIAEDLEIIVIDLAADSAAPLPASGHPDVRLISVPPTTPYGVAHVEGVLRARAPIVGFLEEHSAALPEWAEAMLAAHRDCVAVVGGEMRNPTPGRGITDLLALITGGPWYPPATRGPTSSAQGTNASYNREVLLRYFDQLALFFRAESAFQRRLVRDGYRLVTEPRAAFLHEYDDTVPPIVGSLLEFGRASVDARRQLEGWSTWRRAAYAARCLVILALPPLQTIRRALRSDPSRWRTVLSGLHIVTIARSAFVFGELVGTLRPTPTDAGDRMFERSINSPRALDVSPNPR